MFLNIYCTPDMSWIRIRTGISPYGSGSDFLKTNPDPRIRITAYQQYSIGSKYIHPPTLDGTIVSRLCLPHPRLSVC